VSGARGQHAQREKCVGRQSDDEEENRTDRGVVGAPEKSAREERDLLGGLPPDARFRLFFYLARSGRNVARKRSGGKQQSDAKECEGMQLQQARGPQRLIKEREGKKNANRNFLGFLRGKGRKEQTHKRFFCLVLMCLRKERGCAKIVTSDSRLERQPRGRRLQRESQREATQAPRERGARCSLEGKHLMRAIRTRASGRKEGEGIWEAPDETEEEERHKSGIDPRETRRGKRRRGEGERVGVSVCWCLLKSGRYARRSV